MFAFITGIVILTVLNPVAGIDILLVASAITVTAHVFLQEKLLFVFLIARPIFDYWRNYHILSFQNVDINLNASLSMLFALWVAYMVIRHRKEMRNIPGMFWGAATLCAMIVSATYSISPFTTLVESMKFFATLGFFVISFVSIKKKKFTLHHLGYATLIMAIIPLGAGLLQSIGSSGITTFDISSRVFGSFAHPNIFAFFLLFLSIIFINYSAIQPLNFFKEQAHKKYRYLGYVVLVTLIIQTYTRAAWIGLLAFLLIIGVLHFRKLFVSVLVTVIGFYAIFYPINTAIRSTTDYDLQDIQVISRITSRNEDADSLQWRKDLFLETMPIIRNNPFFGYGYGTFPQVWEKSRNITHLFDDSAEAHNDYLRLSLEIGFLGLGVYLIFLLSLLYQAIHTYWYRETHDKEMLFLIAWIAVFMLMSFSDNMLHHTPVMWLMWSWWGALFANKWNKRKGVGFIE